MRPSESDMRKSEKAQQPDILVTGASGFVGRALVRELRGRGLSVAGFDLDPCADDLRGDVRSVADVQPLVPARGVVFHLASVVGVAHVLRRPGDTWSTAVEGTEVVCRAALECGARVVLTSSSEVYGDGDGSPLAEERPLPASYGAWPRACYPAGKRISEEILLDFCQKGGDGRIARLFNVSGPGQQSQGGMVLPTFVERALRGEPLPVVGDGTDVRSFQHVGDAARGLAELGVRPGLRGALVNIGGHAAVSMTELAERVRATLGSNARVVHVTDVERYGAPTTRCRHRLPNTARARALLGYEARLGLAEIIRDVAAATAEPRVPLAS